MKLSRCMFMTGARQYDDIRLPQETNGCFVAIISERPPATATLRSFGIGRADTRPREPAALTHLFAASISFTFCHNQFGSHFNQATGIRTGLPNIDWLWPMIQRDNGPLSAMSALAFLT